MTPEQRAALDKLTERRKRFVLAYVGEAAGNAMEAARLAGYAKPHPEGARLLRVATVARAVDALRAPIERKALMDVEDLRDFWAQMARDDEVSARDRLKATELLGKSLGAFVEKREVSGPGGDPVAVRFEIAESDLLALASGGGDNT